MSMISFSIRNCCILAAALLCAGPGGAQVLNVPGSDAKLTPSVTGNSSLGNISNPNLFDGSTTVNVPIYSYATDAGDLGISLSYNTKGIKVDELAEHIGVHWSLNAGGTITRVLKDLPDEAWDTDYQALGTTNAAIPYPMVGRMYWYNLTPAELATQQGNRFYHDGESDDFIVSAGRLNFTFNIGKDGQVFSHPHTNARVKFLRNGLPVTMPVENRLLDADYETFSFVITDTEGNSYYFEKGSVQEKIYYDARFDQPMNEITRWGYISQWVISKIVLASGAQVTYNYLNALPGTAPVYQAFTAVEKTASPHYDSRTTPVTQSGAFKDLSSIVYPNGVTATFIYHDGSIHNLRCDNPGIRILDKIRVGTGTQAVQYRLNHVYALSQSTVAPGAELLLGTPCLSMNPSALPATLGHRLRLKSVDILSNDGTVSEPYYSFSYNMLPMPRRLYGGQDYFGYANGLALSETTFQQLIPYHPSPINGQYNGISRTVNAEAIKAGNLVSVANAYGGKSEFTYEAHQLSTVMTGLPTDALFLGKGQSDGLRLKSITETDRFYPGNAKVTSFTYSDGQIFLDGGYFHYPIRTSNAGATIDEYNMGNIYATAHQLISGSNHGYSQVTSEVKDQAGQLLGRKITKFTNFKDENGQLRTYISGGGKKFFELPYSDKQYIRDWEIGLPTTEVVYDQNGRISSMQTNYFRFTMDSAAKTYVYNTKKLETIPHTWQYNSANEYHVYTSDNYSPYTGKALLESTLTQKYVNDNSYITDVVGYSYDSRNNLKTTITRNSEGQDIYSRNVYNYDLSGPGVLQPAPFGTTLWYMNDAGLEKVIGQERWLKASSNSPYSDLLLDASTFGFRMSNGYWVTNWMHNLVSGAPIPYTTYTGISGPGSGLNEYGKIRASYDIGGTVAPSRFRRTSEVLARDGANNPVEVQLLGKEKYNAMIWDVSTGNKLADAANARYNEIAYTSFELPQLSTQNNMVTDGSFTYDQGDINYGVSAISGKGAYQIGTVFGNTPITVAGLTANKTYIVGFWAKDGVPVFSGAGAGTVAFTALKSQSSWTYYEGKFSPTSAGTMTFSATTALYLDELRLFPADAQMVTATYDPFLGKTSAADAAGRISYMEYDKLGRPTLVRDQEGSILSKTEYQVNP